MEYSTNHTPEFDGRNLRGSAIGRITRTIQDIQDIFSDREAARRLPPDTIVYEVESYLPVSAGTAGGLFFGVTFIHPGKVGNEYFMTKGHFHKIPDRGEIYWCIEGEGMLILMDRDRKTRAERMYPGSLHYIDKHTAHRTANTGKSMLSFGAVWPSDADHDYDTIKQYGFSKILIEQSGTPTLANRPQGAISI